MSEGYEALRNTAAWIDSSARGKIRLTGEDAARLLHAMTTNNLKELADQEGLYAFFLNEKGRIIADANIFRLGDDYLLDTESETAEKVYQHLDKFIIADDAYVSDETGGWLEYGIEGPASEAAVQNLGLPIPMKLLDILATEDGYIARVPLGFRIWTQQAQRPDIPQASAEEARIVRLENGIPRYGEDISERYLVQETQALHAVHFNKGCYLGQEIVERVRSLGKVHRLLTAIRITSTSASGTLPPGTLAPPAGTKLTFHQAPAGELTSAAYSPALHEIVALAYLRTEAIDQRPSMTLESHPTLQARLA